MDGITDSGLLNHIGEIAGIAALTAFIPLSAYSFRHYRLDQKAEEYQRILRTLGYTRSDGPAYLPTVEKEYHATDYLFPVTFATVVTLLGAMVLVSGPRFLGLQDVSLLLYAPGFSDFAEHQHALRTMHIIAMAFAGAYLWSIQNLFRRFATIDLPPAAYYGVGIRIILSTFVAIAVYYALPPMPNDSIDGMPAVVAFIAGMFPQRALHYLQERVRFMPKADIQKVDPLPLRMIQGMGIFHRVRFSELGIDNAQNLAQANLVELVLRTPFNPKQLVDWIGQAKLYTHFTDSISDMRHAGVRTIFDLIRAGEADNLGTVIEESGLPEGRIRLVYDLAIHNDDIKHLLDAERRLLGWGRESTPTQARPQPAGDAAN